MTTTFYIKSLMISNFRAFHALEIQKLKRINVIGGFNGSGKTALLESLFLTMDIRNPLCAVKPLLWRAIPFGENDDLGILLKRTDHAATIETLTRDGRFSISIKTSAPPPMVHQSIVSKFQERQAPSASDIATKRLGLDVTAMFNNVNDQALFILPEADGYSGHVYRNASRDIPTAQILGTVIRPIPTELAQKVSSIIKNRRQKKLIEFLSTIQPRIRGLQILQNATGSNVYAEMEDDDLLPIQFLGDGFVSLINIGSSLLSTPGGILFLDEVDNTLHHSTLRKIWSVISQLASTENCQIFVTSHSKESIVSIAQGVNDAGNSKDFQYLRLERLDRKHQAISYEISDILSADEFGIEIR